MELKSGVFGITHWIHLTENRTNKTFLQTWINLRFPPKAKQFLSWWPFFHIPQKDSVPWILIIKANKMHYFSNLFDKVLYMFGTGPLSIIMSISTLYKSTCICHASTYCVYTVLRYSWWWTVDLSETCRVLYQINLRNCAFCWLLL